MKGFSSLQVEQVHKCLDVLNTQDFSLMHVLRRTGEILKELELMGRLWIPLSKSETSLGATSPSV